VAEFGVVFAETDGFFSSGFKKGIEFDDFLCPKL
jgi:hypothetical protein